jgi:hypothetical protein
MFSISFYVSVTGCSCVQLTWLETRRCPSFAGMQFFLYSLQKKISCFCVLVWQQYFGTTKLLHLTNKLNVPINGITGFQ